MISLIVATDENGGIGNNNDIPWMGLYPEDLEFFKQKTLNSVVLMGNNTWKSLPKKVRPLPNRINAICCTHVDKELHKGADILITPHDSASLWDRIETLDLLHDNVFIIGGESIYNQCKDKVQRIYMTIIPGKWDCQNFFHVPNNFELIETINLKNSDNPLNVMIFEKQ